MICGWSPSREREGETDRQTDRQRERERERERESGRAGERELAAWLIVILLFMQCILFSVFMGGYRGVQRVGTQPLESDKWL